MRTSPCWICTRHGLLQVVLRLRLHYHIHLGFSLYLQTVSAISPTYDVETRSIRMCRKVDDDAVVLVLALAPKHSWIVTTKKCCVTCFGLAGPCIMSGFGPS
ncbi:hypothetical protein HU200_037511 [Digitaria exilis]|uniref:Uncharacterized protein n=1 Tax=Digitaria exilis TaxID=1010633 RepID=A0A835BF39_9POAL|nr:hypothetical protein HU200_037511 [Digitaria exilis]